MAPVTQVPAQVPPGTDVMQYALNQAALEAPLGADTTMTTSGPEQVWFIVVAVTCITIPAIFLIVRIYTKRAVVRMFEPADYFIFLAFPLLVVEVAMGKQMVKWGAGVHQWQVTLGQLFNQLYWSNAAEVIYCPLSFLVKMAILLQYIRLFAPRRQVHRTMWYGAVSTIICCFIFYTILMFWTLFYCRPRKMIWNKLTPGGKCHDHSPIVIAQGAFNMASDIIILLLPTKSLWELQVPKGRKIVITLLFATGLVACAASIMRIVYTTKIENIYTTADVSHNGLFIGLWTEAEVALGFVVACSLSLPRLIQAKKKNLSRVFSIVSSPFTSMRTGTEKSLMKSKSTQNTSRSSQQLLSTYDAKPLPPVFYEDRAIWYQKQSGLVPPREEPDAYRLPSLSAYSSSEYSQPTRVNSTRTSRHDYSLQIDPTRWKQSVFDDDMTEIIPQPERSVSRARSPQSRVSRVSRFSRMSVDADILPALNWTPERASLGLMHNGTFMLDQFDFDDIERTADPASGNAWRRSRIDE